MKLYEIPKGSRIKAETTSEGKKLGDFIIFHHLDGMYSFCTIEGKEDKICHLGASQELKKVDMTDYYELASNK
jgi:hypothetical protein